MTGTSSILVTLLGKTLKVSFGQADSGTFGTNRRPCMTVSSYGNQRPELLRLVILLHWDYSPTGSGSNPLPSTGSPGYPTSVLEILQVSQG